MFDVMSPYFLYLNESSCDLTPSELLLPYLLILTPKTRFLYGLRNVNSMMKTTAGFL